MGCDYIFLPIVDKCTHVADGIVAIVKTAAFRAPNAVHLPIKRDFFGVAGQECGESIIVDIES